MSVVFGRPFISIAVLSWRAVENTIEVMVRSASCLLPLHGREWRRLISTNSGPLVRIAPRTYSLDHPGLWIQDTRLLSLSHGAPATDHEASKSVDAQLQAIFRCLDRELGCPIDTVRWDQMWRIDIPCWDSRLSHKSSPSVEFGSRVEIVARLVHECAGSEWRPLLTRAALWGVRQLFHQHPHEGRSTFSASLWRVLQRRGDTIYQALWSRASSQQIRGREEDSVSDRGNIVVSTLRMVVEELLESPMAMSQCHTESCGASSVSCRRSYLDATILETLRRHPPRSNFVWYDVHDSDKTLAGLQLEGNVSSRRTGEKDTETSHRVAWVSTRPLYSATLASLATTSINSVQTDGCRNPKTSKRRAWLYW